MGWKDILRPIRDGLRDNLPHRNPPRNEKDEQKRREDALRGFAYLDTFEEIEAWTPRQVDPIQCANTPLLERPVLPAPVNHLSNITIIHDYNGNYHDYESCQASSLYDWTYTCEYLQYVNNFIYFSHKVVCVPPPSWTNTLHRNGVKSFGTFLVEPQTVDIGKILEKMPSGDSSGSQTGYLIARRLSDMASTYGFDGWLINIEKTFPVRQWNLHYLLEFLTQLRTELGEGNVIWYDAFTIRNTIQYQNALNNLNIPLAQAAGSILVNYAWTPEKAMSTKSAAEQNGIPLENVIVGIDVWAQNTNDHGSARKTWPREGGGGTGTGLGVAELAKIGLSAGIFAPAWPYEHFSHNPALVNGAMWDEKNLPEGLECSCKPPSPHRISSSRDHPITRSARDYPVGSDSFFHTAFDRAFYRPNCGLYSQLASQPVLPSATALRLRSGSFLECSDALPGLTVYAFGENNPSRWSDAVEQEQLALEDLCSLEIFKFYMHDVSKLKATIQYRRFDTLEGCSAKLRFDGTITALDMSTPCQAVEAATINLKGLEGSVLTGLSIEIKGLSSSSTPQHPCKILEIVDILIERGTRPTSKYTISKLLLLPASKDPATDVKHKLQWAWDEKKEEEVAKAEESKGTTSPDRETQNIQPNPSLPYSKVTGPFSYFTIDCHDYDSGGIFTERAYATEHILPDDIAKTLMDSKTATVWIRGYGFDGRLIAECSREVWGPRKDDTR